MEKRSKKEEPIRVLDLGSGQGVVQIGAAARHPNKRLTYVAIDSEIAPSPFYSEDFENEIAWSFGVHPMGYGGASNRPENMAQLRSNISPIIDDLTRRVTPFHFSEHIDPYAPHEFSNQLARITSMVGEELETAQEKAQYRDGRLRLQLARITSRVGEKPRETRLKPFFHEIHYHMPFIYPSQPARSGTASLKVIAKLLRRNGLFYHITQEDSPLLPFVIHTIEPFEAKVDLIKQAAAKTGLKLIFYKRGKGRAANEYVAEGEKERVKRFFKPGTSHTFAPHSAHFLLFAKS